MKAMYCPRVVGMLYYKLVMRTDKPLAAAAVVQRT